MVLKLFPFVFDKMFYTYILYSETISRYYTGSAQNIEERLRRHNEGHSKSTKGKGPWELVISFSFETRAEAMEHERKIKKRGAGRFLKGIGRDG
jgi:putative endonuclease